MPLFSEFNKIVTGICPTSGTVTEATTGAKTDLVDMARYGHCAWIVSFGTATNSTFALTMYLEESTSATVGSGVTHPFNYRASDYPFASTAAGADALGALTLSTAGLTIGSGTSAANRKIYVVELQNDELTDGYPFANLAFDGTTGIKAWNMSVITILSEPRYGGDVPLSAIV